MDGTVCATLRRLFVRGVLLVLRDDAPRWTLRPQPRRVANVVNFRVGSWPTPGQLDDPVA
jgi:hypothetical protein